ncbi:MAG TPA: alpha/beta fold hydrolase [Vineibacter sp.]|nr:alpha/beta fold hydrolase [Vineibacter sp.]
MLRRIFAAGSLAAAAGLRSWPASAQGELVDIKKQRFTTKDFRLENGMVMPEVNIAYETYGTLAADGRNAVLLTHGFTSSQHMAGRYTAGGAEGSWNGLVGPGKAIDTDKLFVVSSNMLGSSYGSTSPAHINPATNKPYGPDFPDISLVDIVTAQKALLDHLGVKHLVAVAGPSFGGYQAFQWGVTFPDFMDGIVSAVSAPKGTGGPAALQALVAQLAKDPNWNDGWYYDKGGIPTVLTDMRIATLKRYGIDDQLAEKFPDKEGREAEIRRRAEVWAKEFDGHSLIALRRASIRFDAEKDLGKIKAKVLYVLSRTDKVFPPSIAPGVMEKLKAAGVSAEYFEIDSEQGHSASGLDAAKWAPKLRAFMAGLEKRS